MCYSAILLQNAKKLERIFNAQMELNEYAELFRRRLEGEKLYLNKAMEYPFTHDAKTPQEKKIQKDILAWHEHEITRLEKELFAQTTRLNDAVRILATMNTKKAQNDQRIATNKISKAKFDLERHRTIEITSDAEEKIFPLHYVSMLCLNTKNEKIIRPARYLMRPHNKDEKFDAKFNGCYNARFDGLESVPWWRDSFTRRHGLILVNRFYENVETKRYLENNKLPQNSEPRENLVLCFQPDNVDYMYIPTLWDEWTSKDGQRLISTALITDEPHEEIARAGHDRTPIFLKPDAVDLWLQAKTTTEAHDALALRERPFYSHKVMGVAS